METVLDNGNFHFGLPGIILVATWLMFKFILFSECWMRNSGRDKRRPRNATKRFSITMCRARHQAKQSENGGSGRLNHIYGTLY